MLQSGRMPRLLPDDCCFRCGEPLPPEAAECPSCGGRRELDAGEESGHIAYLLRALRVAVREGRLPAIQAARVARPFLPHAGWPAAPDPGPERVAPPPSVRPPRPPVNLTVVWANGLLYLGAFLVVITAIVFMLALGGVARTTLCAVGALGFLLAGMVCRRFEIVRTAGTVFIGTGALLIPLVFVAFAQQLEGSGPMATRVVWLIASIACFLVYAVMAVLGLGRFYSVLTLIAASNAFLALFTAAQWDDRWYPTLFGAQALAFVVLYGLGGDALRRTFGVLPILWGWLWTGPTVLGWLIVSATSSDRVAPLPAVALVIAVAWLTHWRNPNSITPVIAGLLQLALVVQAVRVFEAPDWAAGLALVMAGGVYVAAGHLWRPHVAARQLFVLGLLAAVAGAAPFLFDEGRWPGAMVGLLATAILIAGAASARHPLVLFPAAWTLGVGWYFVAAMFRPDAVSAADLGLAYLPIVVLSAAAALVIPLAWERWRWTLAAITGLYAAMTLALTVDRAGALTAALAVATLAGAAFAGRWRAPWLLAAPCATSVAMVLSLLAWLDAPRPLFGPAVLALGLALWTVGLVLDGGHSLVLRLCGGAASAVALVTGAWHELTHTADTTNWSAHLDSLTLLAIAVWIAVESRRRRALLYPASLVAVVAALWEVQALGVTAVQAFAVPLGLYFVAVGLVASRDPQLGADGGAMAASAWTAAGLAFCLPTFVQTFGPHAIRYAVVLLGESFVLILVGLVVKRRGLLACASTFVIVAGLRMVFQNPDLILPALVTASCTFIGVGLVVLIVMGVRRRAASADAPPQ